MKNILISLLLAVITVLWFSDVIFFGNIFVHGDLFRYFYPLREFGTKAVRDLHIPLWISHISCGKPFLASLQSVIFYPLSLIYYLSSSFDNAFNLYVIIHFFLAGVFIYSLMRHWRFSRHASFFSSIIFMGSGYLSSVINMNTSLSSAIWLPVVVLFFDKALVEKKFRFIFISAILLGFQFLGGEPTLVYCSFWILLGYCLFCLGKRGLSPFFLVFGLFFLLFMFQILPFKEFLDNSILASGRSFTAASRWSVSPFELLGFIIPNIGNSQLWLISLYIGVPGVLFGFLVFYFKPDKKAVFLGIVFIVSLFFALGKYTPVYPFLYKYLPGLGNIRYPIKFISISTFSLSILAGMGLESLVKEDRPDRKRLITGILLPLNLAAALLLLFLNNIRYYCQFFIIFSVVSFLVIFYLRGKIQKGIFIIFVMLLVIGDLASVNMGITETMGREFFSLMPDSIKRLKEDNSIFRIYQMEDLWEINRSIYGPDYSKGIFDRKKSFTSNTVIQYGINDVMGYDSIEAGDLHNFVMFLKSQPIKDLARLLDLLNVKYVISLQPIREPGYSVIYKDTICYKPLRLENRIYRNFYINRNDNYMERAFLVEDWVVEKDKSIVLGIMQNENFDPRKVVIIEEEVPGPGAQGVKGEGRCKILSYKPEEVIVEADVDNPKFLVLGDTYYPGWKVFVDGVEDKIYKANYFLRAVYLGSGRHIVRFVYAPFSFKFGMFVSLLGILVCIKIFLRF